MHRRVDAQRQRVERPAAQPRAPQPIAHDDGRRAADALLVGQEAPSDERPYTHHVEELARDGGPCVIVASPPMITGTGRPPSRAIALKLRVPDFQSSKFGSETELVRRPLPFT